MRYNVASLWISEIVEWARGRVPTAFLASFVTMGWIPVALSVVAIDPARASPTFLVAHALVVAFILPAPFYVWYYDERLLPGFFENVEEITESGDGIDVAEVAERYDEYFSRYWWIFVVPWTALGVAGFLLADGYFIEQGVTGTVGYAAYLGIIGYFGLFTGLGIYGGAFMVATIRNVSKRFRIAVEPLHADGSGGLGLMGEFVIRTTVILSTGSLSIPLLLQVAAAEDVAWLIYPGIGLYTVVIAMSFGYPILRVNREARTTRRAVLAETRDRIRELEAEIEELASADGATDDRVMRDRYRELERLERKFGRFRRVQLYPVSVNTMLRLASSVLLPAIFVLFESYLSASLG